MINIEKFREKLNDSSLSENSKKAYVTGLRHYAYFFSEVNSENVARYKSACLSRLSPGTINLRLHALTKYAELNDISLDVRYIRVQEPLFSESILSLKEYDKILDYLKERKQYEWYILFKVLACTGVRINEAHQIKYKDLRKSNKVIIGKGTKTRVIWFPSRMRKDLNRFLADMNPDDYIVRHDDGYIRNKLRFLKGKLGIRCKLSPHEFRRFFAREVYKKAKDVQLVKDLLGHSSVKTTMRYLKVDVSSVSRRISRLVDW